jgi:hypothetical protein
MTKTVLLIIDALMLLVFVAILASLFAMGWNRRHAPQPPQKAEVKVNDKDTILWNPGVALRQTEERTRTFLELESRIAALESQVRELNRRLKVATPITPERVTSATLQGAERRMP